MRTTALSRTAAAANPLERPRRSTLAPKRRGSTSKKARDIPHRMREIAVSDFMLAHAGKMRVNIVMSNSQPARTRDPMAMQSAASTREGVVLT